MYKFYQPLVERFLLLLYYMRDDVGTDYPMIRERVKGRTSPYLSQIVKNITSSDSVRKDIETVVAQLETARSGREEKDLIDKIVDATQLPYVKNVLSGTTIRSLRAAILLPTEMGGLIGRLTRKELSCGQCGAPLHDRESVTVVVATDGVNYLSCHRCHRPNQVPCSHCHNTVGLSDKAQAALSKLVCPECQAKGTEKTPTIDAVFTASDARFTITSNDVRVR